VVKIKTKEEIYEQDKTLYTDIAADAAPDGRKHA
jgi:hypothetical protein